MRVVKLKIRNFRNLQDQVLHLNEGLNVFRGQNGQGKTNLIEAVYLLTMGRSFRTSNLADLAKKNHGNGFYLEQSLKKQDWSFQVAILADGKKRQLAVNNKTWSGAKLRQQFQSVLFSPESLLIVKDSAQKRRDLIDELAMSLYPRYGKIHLEYFRLLKQKKALLRQIRESGGHESQSMSLLNSLNQQVLGKGADLTACRLSAISDISPLLLQEFLGIVDEHYGNVGIEYQISGEITGTCNRDHLHNAMYKRWHELRDRELATGQCLVGPHKHDIDFIFNGEKARFFCSQGQQRAIVLAFKMAQIKLHYRAHKVFPILLLDDVLSELDREKQMRFVRYLLSTRAQILLTTTDAMTLPEIANSSVFEVQEGHFEKRASVEMGGLSV